MKRLSLIVSVLSYVIPFGLHVAAWLTLALGCSTEVSGFRPMETDATTVRRSPGAPMVEADSGVDAGPDASSSEVLQPAREVGRTEPDREPDASGGNPAQDVHPGYDTGAPERGGTDVLESRPDAVAGAEVARDSVPACPAGAIGRCERFPERGCSSDNDCGACANGPAQGRYCPTVGASASACGWCEGSSVATYCTFGGPECGGSACRAGSCGASRCVPCGS